jgi:hypothetical protein
VARRGGGGVQANRGVGWGEWCEYGGRPAEGGGRAEGEVSTIPYNALLNAGEMH